MSLTAIFLCHSALRSGDGPVDRFMRLLFPSSAGS
jgi:hypothetical protein